MGEGPASGERLDVLASVQLPADLHSAGRARTFIREFCTAARLSDGVREAAVLLVSELVTNSVIHGRTSATIEVHQPGDVLRVSVRDDDPALPTHGRPALSAESGRGLLIVSRVAARWGVEPGPGAGKAIWFELDGAAARDVAG